LPLSSNLMEMKESSPPRRAGRVHADRCRDKIDQQEQQLISYG
jgi:hypothetical protein